MEQTIDTIIRRIEAIEQRNVHVTHAKAWEICWTRRIAIALITYVMIGAYMRWLGVTQWYLHALIPTIGFLVSTASLDRLQKHRLQRKQKKESSHT